MSMTREEAVEKIHKLLKLSESDNVNEAAAAARLAQAIMARYQIDALALDGGLTADDKESIEKGVVEQAGRIEHWRSMLLGALCRANTCRALIGRRGGQTVLYVVGRPSYAQAVRYLYAALCRTIDDLAAQHGKGKGRSYASAFRSGAAAAIASTVEAAAVASRAEAAKAARAEAATSANPNALVRVERAVEAQGRHASELEAYMARGTYGKPRRVIIRNGSAYGDGFREGGKVSLDAARAPRLGSGSARLHA